MLWSYLGYLNLCKVTDSLPHDVNFVRTCGQWRNNLAEGLAHFKLEAHLAVMATRKNFYWGAKFL